MTLSVIIPTANRPERVRTLVRQLGRQVSSNEVEIIVVDDSGDSQACLSLAQDCRCLRVFVNPRLGPAAARNVGAAEATGTFLLFLDDDSEVGPGYLTRVADELARRINYAVAGPQNEAESQSAVAHASAWLLEHFTASEVDKRGCPRFIASNGLALRRDDFEGVGGFCAEFELPAGEDREFCSRWLSSGHKLAYLPTLSIRHHFPTTARGFFAQQWRYGRGAAQLRARGASSAGFRAPGFYWRLLWEPLRRFGPVRGAQIALACAAAQAAILIASCLERKQNR